MKKIATMAECVLFFFLPQTVAFFADLRSRLYHFVLDLLLIYAVIAQDL